MTELDTGALVEELRHAHAVHTIVLYGSHARGDATAESDIDVACFAEIEAPRHDARRWRGAYLDAFVYPTAHASAPEPELLRLCGGRVLLDERQLAGPLLARLDGLAAQGPAALSELEQRMRRVWAHKMLARIARGDVEAHYRRHWLLFQLLEDHFALQRRWYRGPKLALAELEHAEPAVFAAFAAALAPGAPLEALAALVARVAGEPPGLSA